MKKKKLSWNVQDIKMQGVYSLWVKEESEKAGLKLHIQKTKIIVSDPIT